MRGAAEAGADVVDIGMVGTEMVYFAVGDLDLEGGIMVTASHNPKEYTGMKIVRRGALPVGGDSGLLDIRTRAMALDGRAPGSDPRTCPPGGHLAAVGRRRPVLHRRRSGEAAARRDRRGERHGRRHASACPRAPADRCGAVLLRAGRDLPEPRAQSAAPGKSRVHHREGQSGTSRPGRCLRRGRGSLLLRRRHRRVRSRRLRHGPPRRVDPREGTGREDPLRRARELGGAADDRARRRRSARQSCRPRVLQAPHARGGRRLRGRGLRPLLLPGVLPGRLGRHSVPAHARAHLEARAGSSRSSWRRTASATSSPAS